MYFSILYILPAVMGAVLVQSIVTMRQLRTTLVAVSCAVAVQFVLIPLWADAALYGVAITVVATVLLSWIVRDRSSVPGTTETDAVPVSETSRRGPSR